MDRPIAIAGLETRLARAFRTDSLFGVFEKYLHRGILWRRASGPLAKIGFPVGVRIPSWSWMAYQGAVDFLDLKLGGIDWEKTDFQSPWASQTTGGGVRHTALTGFTLTLRVAPRAFHYPANRPDDPDERLWYDQEAQPLKGSVSCVVIGREKMHHSSPAKQKYFVLLVRQKTGSSMYERVGVGHLLASSIALDGPRPLVQVY